MTVTDVLATVTASTEFRTPLSTDMEPEAFTGIAGLTGAVSTQRSKASPLFPGPPAAREAQARPGSGAGRVARTRRRPGGQSPS